jgi:hypothetical protein
MGVRSYFFDAASPQMQISGTIRIAFEYALQVHTGILRGSQR